MEVGKLYKVLNHWWALYPTIRALRECGHSTIVRSGVDDTQQVASPEVRANSWARYWSRALVCEVGYITQGDLIVCLEEVDSWYVKILTPNGKMGWILKTAETDHNFSEATLENST